ncbi:MAG TPA: response regulator transcription factor [Bacteroidota bacterium]|nr:response regulator transcription factor [Bacteroidota bacterium]
MKIMIVEDNEPMREVIKTVIGDCADDVIECVDGSDAVASYGAAKPDWVLMDIQMKIMDGITATKNITKKFPQARILIVTDYGSMTLRKAAQDAGACGYVLKENLHEIRNYVQ